jgi:hypothetical protein
MLGTALDLGMQIKRVEDSIYWIDGSTAISIQMFWNEDVITMRAPTWDNNLMRLAMRGISDLYLTPEIFSVFTNLNAADIPFTNGTITVVEDPAGFRVEVNPTF